MLAGCFKGGRQVRLARTVRDESVCGRSRDHPVGARREQWSCTHRDSRRSQVPTLKGEQLSTWCRLLADRNQW